MHVTYEFLLLLLFLLLLKMPIILFMFATDFYIRLSKSWCDVRFVSPHINWVNANDQSAERAFKEELR